MDVDRIIKTNRANTNQKQTIGIKKGRELKERFTCAVIELEGQSPEKKCYEIQVERQSKAKSNDMLFVSNWGSLEADPYVTVSPKYLNLRANGLSPRGWF